MSPIISQIEFPDGTDPETINQLIRLEKSAFRLKMIFFSSMAVIGVVFIGCGIISAESYFRFSFKEIVFEISTVYPGLILAISALLLVLFTKISIRMK